ncbi:MAG: DUF3604 domain-containing protein [Myxococcota bacterium]|nr:DUF3604 domain-containing protein [Myxococcota bacterium]
MRKALLVGVCAGLLAACGDGPPDLRSFRVPAAAKRVESAPCLRREPHRVALFGDLHVHTALSSDAWNYDVEVRPSEAYGYAFGKAILLPPKDAQGRGTREVRIDRPLDFAAITDHAEFLGEQVLCTDPGSAVYESETCRAIRASTTPTDSPLGFKIMHPFPSREEDVCGPDGSRCGLAIASAWEEIIAAADEWHDGSSACRRTTFVAYEYSSHRLGSNLHRNVIFRNRIVPAQPASYMDFQREWELWDVLRETCLESDTGCDVLAIPHNSNISNGRMFAVDYPGLSGEEEQAARASLRMAVEPVVEIMQHKGDSECRNGLSTVLGGEDELCDFEKFEDLIFRRFGDDELPGECWDGVFADSIPHLGPDCLSRRSYVRYALVEGLAEEARIGVNPFKFGIIASTDTHNGLAGGVEERTWPGHLGIADGPLERRLSTETGVMGNSANGPGGLVGVWAEENSRDAIFDALRRREVFGTSGPRIQPRFFGSWDAPADLCDDPKLLVRADDGGVPMGADLPPREGREAPVFVAFAARDPGTSSQPGGLLQRIQVVKGWVDAEGGLHQQVIDVAGGPNDASVDPATCEPRGAGADFLCGVWRDPDFDASRRAVYYARVVENPSCRYSAWQCLGLPEGDRPSGCDAPLMQTVQQERAWTSPIWYTPAGG